MAVARVLCCIAWDWASALAGLMADVLCMEVEALALSEVSALSEMLQGQPARPVEWCTDVPWRA